MKKKGKENNKELKERLVKTDAQHKIEDNVICTNCKKSKGECNKQLGKRQNISKDEGKDAFMDYAYAMSSKGVQWNVIFLVLTVIFTIVKGNLWWNEKYIVCGDFLSYTETKRIRDWHILIEKKEEWKRKLSGLQICKEE